MAWTRNREDGGLRTVDEDEDEEGEFPPLRLNSQSFLRTNGRGQAFNREEQLKVMADAQLKSVTRAAVALFIAGTVAVVVGQSLAKPKPEPPPSQPKGVVAPDSSQTPAGKAVAATPAPAKFKALIFRNQPSWNRSPDFEDTLSDLGIDFEAEPSSAMETKELSDYRFIIIPGAQWRTDFYQTFNDQAERFDRYVTNGGVLVLELNGAEQVGVLLPGGVTMSRHGSRDNTILYPDHPALTPFNGRHIRANYASHGFLEGAPTNALVLAAETIDDKPDTTKPTFIEYVHGAGRVIAACQCFHDQDNSGRGVLMPTLLTYASARKWYLPKK
jgi:hypothetical protein